MKNNLSELTEISLKMLFDAGIINSDTILYSSSTPVKTAKINSDCFIEIIIDGNKKLFPYPSAAARAIVNLSVNGWTFWKVKIEEEFKDLSDLRAIYKARII